MGSRAVGRAEAGGSGLGHYWAGLGWPGRSGKTQGPGRGHGLVGPGLGGVSTVSVTVTNFLEYTVDFIDILPSVNPHIK